MNEEQQQNKEKRQNEEQKPQNEDQHHKNLRRFSQTCTIAGSFWLLILENDYRIDKFLNLKY